MTPILQGLNLSFLGLLFTFLALGVFILIMVILLRVFPYKPEVEMETESEEAAPVEEAASMMVVGCENEEVAAAIAVAIGYFRARGEVTLGANLSAGRGPWWTNHHQAARQGVRAKRK